MPTFKNLVIFEIANNHMGSVNHAFKIIDTYSNIVKPFRNKLNFAFKLQYRDLETFIHPSMKKRTDVHYIKRFLDTKLSNHQMDKIINYIKKKNFLTIATPFDENSVHLVKKQKLDFVKVASCSYNDWPLLEEISKINLPTIISTAGATQDELDKVVAFFNQRKIEFSLMHCVGEYPTPQRKLNLYRITALKERYKNITIGYSSHEKPNNYNNVKIAYGAGARIFEKHVALPTKDYSKNDYSTNEKEIRNWILSLTDTMLTTNTRSTITSKNKKEIETLYKLQRGVFVKKNLKKNSLITKDDVYFAFPALPGQLTANNFSKYLSIVLKSNIKKNQSINFKNSQIINNRDKIYKIIYLIKNLIIKSKVNIPNNVSLEISHHYGIDKFYKYGLTMITLINRVYCKKLLLMLPNQSHPDQYHKIKEETFIILYGEVELFLDGMKKNLKTGDTITIKPFQIHFFKAKKNGCIIEELSSTHFKSDSFYLDKSINKNKNRKTIVNHWI